MSKSEDYLDQLLKGMNQQDDMDAGLEEDFLEEGLLEEDLLEEDLLSEAFLDDDASDDFLKEFELEMAGLEDSDNIGDMSGLEELLGLGGTESAKTDDTDDEVETAQDAGGVEDLFENLDSIVSGAKEQMEVAETEEVVEEEASADDFSVEEFSYDDIASDLGITEDDQTDGEDVLEALSIEEPGADESAPAEPAVDDGEADVMKILEGLGDIGLELEMEAEATEQTEESKANDDALLSFLAGSAATDSQTLESGDSEIESFAFDEETAETEDDKKKNKKNKKDKKKPAKSDEKGGFFNKLGTILFGEDDEEEESTAKAAQKQPEQAANSTQPEAKIEEFSGSQYDDLFKDFATTTSSAPVAETPEEPEDKKKGKKKKPKREKVKKEKKPKPKKEKKPKKPKEPDNTPPLPKKPVFLIFLMVGSLVALIVVGTDLVGYNNGMNDAKNAYAKQNYSEAYAYVAGMEIKEKDLALYEKYQTMALVASEFDAYENLMEGEFYDMALDCLVRTIGRAEKYSADAETYGCIKELNAIELEAENILSETFKLTKEDALELYGYRDRRDYSKALNEILKELGMEKVTEE